MPDTNEKTKVPGGREWTREGPFAIGPELVLGVSIPVFRERPRSLAALLVRSAAYGDAPYLVFGDRRLSFREHLASTLSVAAALRDRFGVGKGDRVAILAANCPEWIIAFWAATSLGAVVVGMNGWWTEDEIGYALEDSSPKLLIADTKRLDRVRGVLSVPVVEIEAEFSALLAHDRSAGLPGTAIDEDDPAVILYTSGTSGRPKGVVNTHRNILALISIQAFHGARLMAESGERAAVARRRGRSGPHCRLTSNPLFHVSGLYASAVAHLASGIKSVWTVGRFDPGQVLELIQNERVNGWSPQGAMAWRVLQYPGLSRYDVSSLQMIGCGGAPVTREVQQGLRRAFPNAESGLAVGYGLTECTALATINYGSELRLYPDSVGQPLPTVALEIRDELGRALPEGVEGEVAIRSPLVMREYWRNPVATAAALGEARWLRSGDIGRLEAGRLFIASRRGDLILRAAENVYPAEIENRLAAHPGVLEVAVIGVDSEELGQEVKAVIVLKPGVIADSGELARFVAEKLAYYKVPSVWEFRTEPLVRTASGKVMKFLLGHGRS